MGTHPIFESDFDCLTVKMDQFVSHQASKAEISRLREDYNLVSVQIDNEGSTNMNSIYASKFQLGHALVHSIDRSDIPSGIEILEELIKKHHDSDARRDYSYFIGIGYYRLKEYELVIKQMKKILTYEKQNHQALNLMNEAERRLKRDGLIGIGVATGAAAVGAAVLTGLVTVLAKKK